MSGINYSLHGHYLRFYTRYGPPEIGRKITGNIRLLTFPTYASVGNTANKSPLCVAADRIGGDAGARTLRC
jgi:hypothetical protein